MIARIGFAKSDAKPGVFSVILVLLLFCIRVFGGPEIPMLPPDVTMNKDAGRDNAVFLMIHLNGSEPLVFILDTGTPYTIFDKSLAGKLGKRFDTWTIQMLGGKERAGIYAPPRLFLGTNQLLNESNFFSITFDLKGMSKKWGRPISGVLGMDCLKNYCIQLDFEAGKMRFLDDKRMIVSNLGFAFPMRIDSNRPFIHYPGLFGATNSEWLLDTGCNVDGLLEFQIFHRFVKQYKPPRDGGLARIPSFDWNHETYTDLTVGQVPDRASNCIGLRFLARHLITLDFPNQTIYFKKRTSDPLAN